MTVVRVCIPNDFYYTSDSWFLLGNAQVEYGVFEGDASLKDRFNDLLRESRPATVYHHFRDVSKSVA